MLEKNRVEYSEELMGIVEENRKRIERIKRVINAETPNVKKPSIRSHESNPIKTSIVSSVNKTFSEYMGSKEDTDIIEQMRLVIVDTINGLKIPISTEDTEFDEAMNNIRILIEEIIEEMFVSKDSKIKDVSSETLEFVLGSMNKFSLKTRMMMKIESVFSQDTEQDHGM